MHFTVVQINKNDLKQYEKLNYKDLVIVHKSNVRNVKCDDQLTVGEVNKKINKKNDHFGVFLTSVGAKNARGYNPLEENAKGRILCEKSRRDALIFNDDDHTHKRNIFCGCFLLKVQGELFYDNSLI